MPRAAHEGGRGRAAERIGIGVVAIEHAQKRERPGRGFQIVADMAEQRFARADLDEHARAASRGFLHAGEELHRLAHIAPPIVGAELQSG